MRLTPRTSATRRAIIEAQTPVRFDRANFKEFKDGALVFEVVFYVLGPDYNLYMDVQERINLALHRHLRAEGIALALPRRFVEIGENLGGILRTPGPEVDP